ncbi:hypothetical protein DFA_03302 [Cavenderia fasciculata]|uniref:G-patch domain-containing protein n=1 Tax=Cavenderia fasciculata TaxID=261658 RepID=F4PH72_CACFS|nr:uncharacterized protein DFA_03302 [Cavenderia fasciculata]EGG25056.1 hypothetical protein DFA_03302 [Cavenderia fasciculata]|eukprot:XP_004362907.1 hypothetical protein DFA_03302 [Cavenderia fasciculata]
MKRFVFKGYNDDDDNGVTQTEIDLTTPPVVAVSMYQDHHHLLLKDNNATNNNNNNNNDCTVNPTIQRIQRLKESLLKSQQQASKEEDVKKKKSKQISNSNLEQENELKQKDDDDKGDNHNHINNTNTSSSSSSFYCEYCEREIMDCKVKYHNTTTAHLLAMKTIQSKKHYHLPPTNRGYMMMKEHMGWEEEIGLGANGQGQLDPVKTRQLAGRGGIGNPKFKDDHRNQPKQPIDRIVPRNKKNNRNKLKIEQHKRERLKELFVQQIEKEMATTKYLLSSSLTRLNSILPVGASSGIGKIAALAFKPTTLTPPSSSSLFRSSSSVSSSYYKNNSLWSSVQQQQQQSTSSLLKRDISTSTRSSSYAPPLWEKPAEQQKLNTVTTPSEEEPKEYKEGILWINNLYPIKISRLDFRSLLFHIPITERLKAIFPKDVEILSIEKRFKEGGAYVYFRSSSKEESVEDIANRIEELFNAHKKHFHFSGAHARSTLVKGKPFVDDIDVRLPSYTLKLTFKGAELQIDDVFRLLRPYGHIRHMYIPDNIPKDQPKYAIITFRRMEGAIAARNCLHNEYLPEFGTTLYFDYELMMRINKLKDQFSKHPKIMIPLAGILATLLTILLFNPLREYFMDRELDKILTFEDIDDDWQTRIEEKMLNSHFNYRPNSIIMISAPKGSGKSSLIDKIIEGRPNTLLVDCTQEVNANDEEFIENLSKAIGFFPSFGVYGSLLGWVDMIIPTGKGIFHSSTNNQLQTIFKLLDNVLERRADKEFPVDQHQPYPYPLIVIDGFFGMIAAMENKEKANLIQDSIIQWAITSTIKGNAHVVFISSDPFAGDTIKKHLTNRGGGIVNTIHLGDVPPVSAQEYIRNKLGKSLSNDDFENIASLLGGRYSDLNMLAQKVMSGDSVPMALNGMVNKAVGEIRADGFGLSKRSDSKKDKESMKWTRPQIWETIKRIAESNYVSYDDLLFSVFIGDETSLNNLILSGLLRFQSINNERMVTAYSPLYRSAFKAMVDDLEFCVGMDIFAQKSRIEEELNKLSKVEDELLKLKNLSANEWFESAAFKKRRVLLEDKMKEHVSKIDTREKILKTHLDFQKFIQQSRKDNEYKLKMRKQEEEAVRRSIHQEQQHQQQYEQQQSETLTK